MDSHEGRVCPPMRPGCVRLYTIRHDYYRSRSQSPSKPTSSPEGSRAIYESGGIAVAPAHFCTVRRGRSTGQAWTPGSIMGYNPGTSVTYYAVPPRGGWFPYIFVELQILPSEHLPSTWDAARNCTSSSSCSVRSRRRCSLGY